MKSDNSPLNLGSENIRKLLIQNALPAIISMAAASLYNITDSIFIGHGVGDLALAGITISFPIMNLAVAFGCLVAVGTSTLLSIRMGQNDYETANKILGNALILNLIMGAVFSVVALIFLDSILYFFGANPETITYARDFMKIILYGNVISYVYFGLNAILRSSGNPKKAMLSAIYTVLINLILNPLFIFGFKWGIKGSALATVISQTILLCWQIYLFSNKKNHIHWERGIYNLKKKIVTDSFSIGIAPCLMNMASCLILLLIIKQLTIHGGDLAVSAYGIVSRIATLFIMVVVGLNMGMQPIAGYNYGAKLYDRVLKVLKESILYATLIMIIGFTIIELFPHAIASAFTTEEKLIEIAVSGLRWTFTAYPLVGFQIVCSTFFQSIGKPKKSIILATTRQVVFLIPFLLILPNYWGITGVWASLVISDFISVLLAGFLLYLELKTKNKN